MGAPGLNCFTHAPCQPYVSPACYPALSHKSHPFPLFPPYVVSIGKSVRIGGTNLEFDETGDRVLKNDLDRSARGPGAAENTTATSRALVARCFSDGVAPTLASGVHSRPLQQQRTRPISERRALRIFSAKGTVGEALHQSRLHAM